jgi:hypothetical protein
VNQQRRLVFGGAEATLDQVRVWNEKRILLSQTERSRGNVTPNLGQESDLSTARFNSQSASKHSARDDKA